MTDPKRDTGSDFRDWVTGGGGEGDPALSLPDIVSEMNDRIGEFSHLISSEAELPEGVRLRPRTFTNPSEIEDYLSDAGLLWEDDSSPTGFKVSDFAYVLPYIDPDNTDYIEWDLYITDDSP